MHPSELNVLRFLRQENDLFISNHQVQTSSRQPETNSPILLQEVAVVAPHTADGVNAWWDRGLMERAVAPLRTMLNGVKGGIPRIPKFQVPT